MRGLPATLALALGLLLATGFALRPLAGPVSAELARGEPAGPPPGLGELAGEGVFGGLLGGFRAVVADFLWLRVNALWEDGDLPGTQTALRLVGLVDPRPLFFWVNGARMIGYDMPGWRIEAAGGPEAVPVSVQQRIDEEQARLAIAHLERGLVHHPRNPWLYIEIANLQLHRRHDVEAAAAFYRLAAVQAGAPYFAARIHGELLRRLGRDREAYDWLVAVHRRLPPDDPRAVPEVVLARIRVLEEKLALPVAERYRPDRP